MNIPGLGEVTGCVVAWRAWNISQDGLLSSVTMRTIWKPTEVMRACCMDNSCGGHDDRQDMCGLWAMKERPDFGAVIGRVALWGEVIEHEKGYRAEYAYPISLLNLPFLPDPTPFADAYGIPVEKPTYEELWEHLKHHNRLKSLAQSQALSAQQNRLLNTYGAQGGFLGVNPGYQHPPPDSPRGSLSGDLFTLFGGRSSRTP